MNSRSPPKPTIAQEASTSLFVPSGYKRAERKNSNKLNLTIDTKIIRRFTLRHYCSPPPRPRSRFGVHGVQYAGSQGPQISVSTPSSASSTRTMYAGMQRTLVCGGGCECNEDNQDPTPNQSYSNQQPVVSLEEDDMPTAKPGKTKMVDRVEGLRPAGTSLA